MAYTILESKSTNTGMWYKMTGPSADKPTGKWIGLNSEYEENDTGVTKYFVGGSAPWATKKASGGSGGGEGGSLPANFPEEDITNANKFIGFDASGEYAAKDAPSGGAEKFVVTFTKDNDNYTADKTIAEIVAAEEAGHDVIAKFGEEDFGFAFDVPCVVAETLEEEGVTSEIAIFNGIIFAGHSTVVCIIGEAGDGSDVWQVELADISDDSSGGGAEKFVVTFTKENDSYTADKTIAEIVAAKEAGSDVVAKFGEEDVGFASDVPCTVATTLGEGDELFSVAIFSGIIFTEDPAAACIEGATEEGSDIWRVDLKEIKNELPAFDTSTDVGKVLTVTADGLAWVTPT